MGRAGPHSGPKLFALGPYFAFNRNRQIQHAGDFAPQFEVALRNFGATLRDSGGQPKHIIELEIHTTEMNTYRYESEAIGEIWIENLAKHFPVVNVIEVNELLYPKAVIQISGTAFKPYFFQ